MIGMQALSRIEFLHSMSFLHRDLKPDNFMLGRNEESHVIYLIDFGLSKRYISKDLKHIPYKENKSLTGTARYASVNTHLGIEQSRRDDIESLGYILIYFLHGQLPWQNQPGSTEEEKYNNITRVKMACTTEQLTRGLPEEFTKYMNYSKNLDFKEKPDYLYLKSLLQKVFDRMGFEKDFKYDWVATNHSFRHPLRESSKILPFKEPHQLKNKNQYFDLRKYKRQTLERKALHANQTHFF